MIKRKQLFRHQPELGIYGDCHRTALACLLDMEPSEVPHFMQIQAEQGTSWIESQMNFLAARGLWSFEVYVSGEIELSAVLQSIGAGNPGAYWLLGGKSPRGTNHTVIACGDGLYWDPHPDGDFLVGPLSNGAWSATVLMPLSQLQSEDQTTAVAA